MNTAAIRTTATNRALLHRHAVAPLRGRRGIVAPGMKGMAAKRAAGPPATRRARDHAPASASRAYSEHVGANRQRAAARARPAAGRPRPAPPPTRPRPHGTRSPGNGTPARSCSCAGQRRERLRSAPPGRPMTTSATLRAAPRRGWPGTPRAAGAAPGCAARRPDLSAHGEARAPSARPSRATARSSAGRSIRLAPLEERLEFGAAGQPLASGKPSR